MILSYDSIEENRTILEAKGYKVPKYNRGTIRKNTQNKPIWIHFGAGNLFRAFHSNIAEKMLESGEMETGLIVAEGFDYEIIEKINRPYDDYSILVTLKNDGSMEKRIMGSVVQSYMLNVEEKKEFEKLKNIFSKPSLQMATFTITEKGYSMVHREGSNKSYIGMITALLYHRYLNGGYPIAMVSTDNCSHNGSRLYDAIMGCVKIWQEEGSIEEGFADYVSDSKKVSFPWTMIDKITPRPNLSVEAAIREDGIENVKTIVTKKNTYIAPFVNAEESQYLVIEDSFPNGRPLLEKAGVIFADRETVDRTEKMKVCTCLNPLHTALAIFGCLLGYDKIWEEMRDKELRKMAELIGYREGLPVVINPGVIDPERFINDVINIRISNPFMPDTPERIVTDTSQKLAIRFGETIKSYLAEKKDMEELKVIPLVFAGWLRYLMAVDDSGNDINLSPDPLLDQVCPYVANFKLGDYVTKDQIEENLRNLLSNEKIWGINLYYVNLAEKVCKYFGEMIAHKGAVRDTLKKYIF